MPELPMRAHPFRLLCLRLLDQDGNRDGTSSLWTLLIEDWIISYYAGDLIFFNQTDHNDENVTTVWNDQRGGQMVEDLSPYEALVSRWLVLERLAEA